MPASVKRYVLSYEFIPIVQRAIKWQNPYSPIIFFQLLFCHTYLFAEFFMGYYTVLMKDEKQRFEVRNSFNLVANYMLYSAIKILFIVHIFFLLQINILFIRAGKVLSISFRNCIFLVGLSVVQSNVILNGFFPFR